jgi:hypothetical protein
MGEEAGGAMAWRQRVGFFALCAMAASGWLMEGAWPSTLPVAARQCLHELAIAVVVGGFSWRRFARKRAAQRGRWRVWVRLSAASVGLLAVPVALIESTRGGVSAVTVAGLFALAPVGSGGADAGIRRAGVVNDAMRLLGPAVLGLAGVLLDARDFALPADRGATWASIRW